MAAVDCAIEDAVATVEHPDPAAAAGSPEPFSAAEPAEFPATATTAATAEQSPEQSSAAEPAEFPATTTATISQYSATAKLFQAVM